MDYKYKRVLLKISGESLKGDQAHGYDADAVEQIVDKIRKVVDRGVEVALVVGAGNIWRGVMGSSSGMDRVNADYMGMLGTVMNALCLRDFFSKAGLAAEIHSSINMVPMVKMFDRKKANLELDSGKIVIFAGGTGSPFFTTDTTAVLRALELDCQAVLKATKVDGIYDSDPFKNPDAVRYSTLSFAEAMNKQLAVMDQSAFAMCRENNLPIIVFNFADEDSLDAILHGDTSSGTIVS